jgi:hypothetical protein
MRRNTPVLIAPLVFVFGLCFSARIAWGQSPESTTRHQFQLKNPPRITHGTVSREVLRSLAAAQATRYRCGTTKLFPRETASSTTA